MDTSNSTIQLLPFVLIFVVFYFFLIRPQQKQVKRQKAMLAAIKRGDRIVTGGGLLGLVTKAQDDELVVEIAENVRVKILRATVSNVLSKTETKSQSAGAENETDGTSAQETEGGKKSGARRSSKLDKEVK